MPGDPVTAADPADKLAGASDSLTWSLTDPGMGLPERAGLAALWLTLKAADRNDERAALEPLTWEDGDLTDESVTVRWHGPPGPAFGALVRYAWQLRGGVLYLPAVQPPTDIATVPRRVAMHNGILGTFLQHTTVQPKAGPNKAVVDVDGREVVTTYMTPFHRLSPKAVADGKSPDPKLVLVPWKDTAKLFTPRGQFSKSVGLSSWADPGTEGRYGPEKRGKAVKRPPSLALLLMLSPIACGYFRTRILHRTKSGKKADTAWLSVMPDARSLSAMRRLADAQVRTLERSAVVGSLGDAALRFLSTFYSTPTRGRTRAGCRVVAIGKADYYFDKQPTRRGVVDVSFVERASWQYLIVRQHLGDDYVPIKSGDDAGLMFIKAPTGRGRIADNLAAGRPWYTDLVVPLVWDEDELDRLRKKEDYKGWSVLRIWFDRLSNPFLKYSIKPKLMAIVQQDGMWEGEADERRFVEACWQTLSRLYHHEQRAAARGGSRTPKERKAQLTEGTPPRADAVQDPAPHAGVLRRVLLPSADATPRRRKR